MACTITVSALCGCANQTKPDVNEVAATSVDYNADGVYTTDISGADFSGIQKSDVKVIYALDKNTNAGSEQSTDPNAQSADPNAESETESYTINKEAEIIGFKANSLGMTLSFKDDDAKNNFTDCYSVVIESRRTVAAVDVLFEEHKLLSAAPYVLSSDTDFDITLTLDGEFKDITANDITLYGSFEGMTIAENSITCANSTAGATLSFKIEGNLKKDEAANLYPDGIVDIAANAIEGARQSVSAKIPVETTSAYFVGEELQGSGTTYTIPLVLIDCEGVDAGTLSASRMSFNDISVDAEGATTLEPDANISVRGIAKTSDNTRVNLTLNIANATDLNSAAEAINGKVIKIGDFEFSANIASAYFYPKFEYMSESDGKFEFTLELTAHAGTFRRDISANDIELKGGFANASDKTLSFVSDTQAELKFKIPKAEGQTVDNLNIDGEVTIKAGALVNAWGAVASKDATYSRSYSQETMGKNSPLRSDATTLTPADIDKIKSIVGGFGNGKLATFASVALNGLNIASGILTIVDFCLPKKEDVILELLQDIAETINAMKDLLNKQMALLRDTKRDIYKSDLASFDTQISTLGTLNKIVSDFLASAAAEELGGVKLPDGFLENLPKKEDGTYDYDKVTDEQGKILRDYSTQLVMAIEASENSNNPRYKGFADMFKQLESLYRTVIAQVTKTDEQNPMAVFDKLCSLTYNFSTSAYGIRSVQRLTIAKTLGDAMRNIVTFYGCDAENAINKSALESYKKFSALINEDTSKGEKVGAFAVLRNESDEFSENNKTAMCYSLGYRIALTEFYWFGQSKMRSRKPEYTDTVSLYTYKMNSMGQYEFARFRDFTDDEIQDFIGRMDGRTLKEELELARFEGEFVSGNIVFERWRKRENGILTWDNWRHGENHYALIMRLDKKTTEQVITYAEYANLKAKRVRYMQSDAFYLTPVKQQ